MKVLFLLLVASFVSVAAYAQSFKARVVDEAGNGISYANIGIMGTSQGTVSDVDGNFEWPSAMLNDEQTVRISAIGYTSSSLSGFDFYAAVGKSEVFTLRKRVYVMPTVTVETSKARVKRIGSAPRATTASYRVTTTAGSEIGMRIKGPKEPYAIKKFVIYVNDIKKDYIHFRLNFYEYKGDSIGERINSRNILMRVYEEGANEWDLAKYDLSARGDVFVSLEYIEKSATTSLLLKCNLTGGTVWYKQGVEAPWEKLEREDAGGLRIEPCYQLEIVY